MEAKHELRVLWKLVKNNLIVGGILVCWTYSASSSPGDAAKFKSFIESPPIVTRVSYAHYYPGRTNQYPVQYFTAKWQTNAFLRIASDDIQTVTTLPKANIKWKAKASCQCKNIWWKIDGAHKDEMVWDQNTNPKDNENQIKTDVSASLQSFSSLMNMGVEHVGIASIHWDGDAFCCTNIIDGDKWCITGQLVTDALDRAKEMDLDLVFFDKTLTEPRRWKWVLDYSYNVPLSAAYLPDKITTRSVTDHEDVILDEYKIITLQTADRPLPAASFSADIFKNAVSRTYFESNNELAYLENGVKHIRMKNNDPRILKPTDWQLRILYYILIVVLFIPVIAILLKQNVIRHPKDERSK
ncbi:MAG TPA: hypothetical protein VGO67_06890 [Verrucomicrobiae bacterium]|jgi:hypothetical protein